MSQEVKNFVVYKSSAGSGKTYTLVREYLKIVLQNPDLFRHVLAITFTNKAANEMKERVVRYLIAIGDPESRRDDPAVRNLLSQLSTDLKLNEEQIIGRAEQVLRLIIHHYSEFSISTIDSFTHRVIRTFAHDLKIPMDFEVELETEAVLAEAVDELISRVGSDPKLTRILVEFVEKKAGDEQNWQVEKDLLEFGKALLNEDSVRFIGELRRHNLDTFMEVRGRLSAWIRQFRQRIPEMARKALSLASSCGLNSESVHHKSKGVLAYLERACDETTELTLPNSYARKSLETGEWLGSNVSPVIRSGFEQVKHMLIPLGKEIVELLDVNFPRYTVCRLLLNNLYSTAVLGELENILHTICQDNNKLLISEFNRRISAVVREQPAPYIYERLGERYQHYLLDEFQDTSIMQWHNLLPLIENSLASLRLNLVVGDSKQAIYRWRAGDARQFEMLPELIREMRDPILEGREKILKDHFRQENLEMNHRSSPVIVDFNNRFFQTVSALLPEEHTGLYADSAQVAAKTGKTGMVRIDIVPDEDPSGMSYDQMVREKIFSTIEELGSDGYSLHDIAILCRKNSKASEIAAFLIKKGIRVISSESLLLRQSDEVNFLLAWTRHLQVRTDPLPLVHIVLYLNRHGFVEQEDFEQVCPENLTETGGPDEIWDSRLNRFTRLIQDRFPDFQYQNLRNYDLQGLFRYLTVFFRLNIQADSYLRFFMDYVTDFMRKKQGGIDGFLEWWDEKSEDASMVIPEGIDAVKIMTIHKAKGLQFPVVIFPFADEEFRTTRKNLWVYLQEELARPLTAAYLPARKELGDTVYAPVLREEKDLSVVDMVNVLYVALTRPEERLYVITRTLPSNPEGSVSVPRLFLQFFQSEGTFASGKTTYQYGEPVKKHGGGYPAVTEEPAAEPYAGKAALNLLLRRHAPDYWETDDPDRNLEWGNRVHALMSRLRDIREMDAVIEDMLNSGEIERINAGALKRMAWELMHHPGVAELFDPEFEVFSEAEILTSEGKSFRPDRIAIRQGQALIVDYKTGSQRRSHHEQVLNYASLLREMDFFVHGGYILYLNEKPELVKVV